MLRIVCIALLLSLTACGLADTATTAAAGGAAKAQEVQQAKETQEKLHTEPYMAHSVSITKMIAGLC